MAANELVRQGVIVIYDYLIKECQHVLEKRNKRKKKKRMLVVNSHITFQ
jgi:predicted nucleic acid-binding Zn ribbon protein